MVHCPLCAAEMKTLQSLDTQKKLRLENIHDEKFPTNYPYIDRIEAIDYCMFQLDNGQDNKGLMSLVALGNCV